MAKENYTRLEVSHDEGFENPFLVVGTLAESSLGHFVFTLKHPYPGFDVESGWYARGRGIRLTINGPRQGQKITCSR